MHSLLGIIGIYLYSFNDNELEIFFTTLGKFSCGIEISFSLLVNLCR